MEKVMPKVSVLMPTYNHEKYIESAIESFLNQKTDFAKELLIVNKNQFITFITTL